MIKNKRLRVSACSGSSQISQPDWLPLLQSLVRAYQAFDRISERNIRQLKLTGPQFDIIATLGNSAGMTCKELGRQTLITKGTLTGVLDRLEGKGLLKRFVLIEDRRVFTVKLTDEGQAIYDTVFPEQMAFLDGFFQRIESQDRQQLERLLDHLRQAFQHQ